MQIGIHYLYPHLFQFLFPVLFFFVLLFSSSLWDCRRSDFVLVSFFHFSDIFFRSILRNLVHALNDDVLTCYEKLLQSHKKDKENIIVNQNRALQLLFDFKFISTIFGERSKTEVKGLLDNTKKNSRHCCTRVKSKEKIQLAIFDLIKHRICLLKQGRWLAEALACHQLYCAH